MEAAWEDVPLGQVGQIAKGLCDDKKYAIIKFSNPSAATFMNYQQAITVYEFHKEVLKAQIGQQTEADAVEAARSQLVKSMRHGKFLMIDLSAVTPNLIANTTDNWPANDIWNYAKWDEDATNKSILKDGEDEDHMGNKGFHK